MISFSERTAEQAMERGMEKGLEIGRNEMLDMILSIRQQYKNGESVQSLAVQTGLSVEHISSLV